VYALLGRLPLWGLMVLVLVGFPATAVAMQAVIRRRFPALRSRRHNSVAGFLVAVIGVIYAVTVGFIISNQWNNYTQARERTFQEAFTLASIAEGSEVLGPAKQAEITRLVIQYDQIVINWWPQSGREPATADPNEDRTLAELLNAVSNTEPTTEGQRAFVQRATEDLMDVNAQNDQRLHQASRAHLEQPLWVVIGVSSVVTVAFCLLFGLQNEWLHYIMVAGVSLAIASNLLLVILLDHPLSGVMPVSPDAYQSVIYDLTP
jgi:hypothetical protein